MNTATRSKVTIADVARQSGVSAATVSLVLRDKPGISSETRTRVLDSAQKLGYLQRTSNQSDARTSETTIGLFIKGRPDDDPLANYFYAPILAGIETICRKRSIKLLYSTIPVDERNIALELPPLLTNAALDGLLLVGVLVDETLCRVLQALDSPTVLVDAYIHSGSSVRPFYDSVLSDNEAGAYAATSYLIDRGHSGIVVIGGQESAFPSLQQRRAGYVRAMCEQNLSPHFVDCDLQVESVTDALERFLPGHSEVHALFACNDMGAIASIQTAQRLGRQIPGDLSVIGFDNIALAQHISPMLTTMRVDKMRMGRIAAQQLVDRVEHPEAGFVTSIVQPSLLERETVQAIG